MSESKQRRARDRRDAAARRAQSAYERAERNYARGEPMLGRRHEETADRQAEAAEAAERVRQLDVAIEGDRLDEDAPPARRADGRA